MLPTLQKWRRLGSPGRGDALHALLWLLVARTTLRLLPYNAVRRLVPRIPMLRARRRSMTAQECETALRRAAVVMPRSSCLARAVAAACLLRRQGRPAVLTIGVGFAEDEKVVSRGRGFLAHAWVESDGIVVSGADQLATCKPLLRDAIPARADL